MRVDSFGATLRQLREAHGLTQEQLAERAGVSANAVSSLERGIRRRPYPHTVAVLGRALGLDATELAELMSAVPPRSLSPGLPASPDGLVGRDEARAAASDQLRSATRLLTLTGPGGIGKTRLALAVANEVADAFGNGAVFLSLASVREAAHVIPTIAEALGLRALDTRPLAELMREFLRRREILLVLDNLEHLPDAAADLADLLAAAPKVKILATSRSPLRVRGEQLFPVAPLDAAAAVELFTQRMRQLADDPSPGDLDAIARLCERLGQLPLAIELAAARTRVLRPHDLLARLDPELRILGSGPRDLPERQRTISGLLDWSYQLLGPGEQSLLRQLAVFAGGWTLEAAASVGDRDEGTAVDEHAQLIESSLVGRSPRARYDLQESVRGYAGRRLASHGEEERARDLHAAYYSQLAADAATSVWAPAAAQAEVFTRLRLEHDNLQAAWSRLLGVGDLDRLADMVPALWPWWMIGGHLTEGVAWTQAALTQPTPPSGAARGRLQLAAGCMHYAQGQYAPAAELLAEAALLAGEHDDQRTYEFSLAVHANVEAYRGQLDAAERLATRYREAVRPDSDKQPGLLLAIGDAHIAIAGGGLGEARRILTDAMPRIIAHGALWTNAVALGILGRLALELDRTVASEQQLRDSVLMFSRLQDRWGMVHQLTHLADAAAFRSEPTRATLLYGAVDTLVEQTGARIFPTWQQFSDRYQAAVIDDVGLRTFAALRQEGRQLDLDEVIALAVDEGAHETVPVARQRGASGDL